MAPTKPKGIRPISVQNLIVNMCLTAESGFGKSVFAGTAPRPLVLSADPEGTDSIAFSGAKGEEYPVRTLEDLQESYLYFRDGAGCTEYEWVIIDSAPEIQKIMMRASIDKGYKENPVKRDKDIPAQQDYLRVQLQFLEFVKRWNELPVNVLYTAHPAEFIDGEGEVYYLPAIHGAQGDIARSFIGYMKINTFGTFVDKDSSKTRVRRYYMTNHGPYRAKERYFGALGNYKDDLTIPRMMEIIRAKAAGARRPVGSASRSAATTPVRRRAARG